MAKAKAKPAPKSDKKTKTAPAPRQATAKTAVKASAAPAKAPKAAAAAKGTPKPADKKPGKGASSKAPKKGFEAADDADDLVELEGAGDEEIDLTEFEAQEETEEVADDTADDTDSDDADDSDDAEVVSADSGDDEDVILTDAEGNRYCRVRDCDQISTVDGYCRYHYLLLWKKIQVRKKILTDGKLEFYIVELTARYPDKFLEMIRKDLRNQKDFLSAIQELEIDESGLDNDFEEEDTQFIDEVRGMGTAGGSEPSESVDDDF